MKTELIKPKNDNFLVGVDGKAIAARDSYWDTKTVDKLRQSFDSLKEARQFQLHKNKMAALSDKDEELFQAVGKGIMELAKIFRGVKKKDE